MNRMTQNRFDAPEGDVSIITFAKGKDRYFFFWTDEKRAEILRQLGRFASNPELNFSWYDAVELSKRVKEIEAMP